jgi:hypothetical protein
MPIERPRQHFARNACGEGTPDVHGGRTPLLSAPRNHGTSRGQRGMFATRLFDPGLRFGVSPDRGTPYPEGHGGPFGSMPG